MQRLFYVSLGILFIVVAVLGFGPNQLDHLAGKLDISTMGQMHGVLMVTWLLTFITQAALIASGRTDLHRTLGAIAICLGVVVWLSVVSLTAMQLADAAVPLDKRIDGALPQLYVILVFLPLFVTAIRRRRNPPWHKRLLAISMIALLQAAVDRFRWLPDLSTGYWPQVACLDVLLLVIVVFDLATLKRVHKATLVGGGSLLVGQSVVAVLWGAAWWPPLAKHLAQMLQQAF